MADKSDEMWTKALSWPDCLNEPGLMGMISDADMLHMMEDPSKHSEQDISDVQKGSAHVPDAEDALDSEPPSKLQATCKLDSQTAKTKAHREKQRRAQLNNKCGLCSAVCAVQDVQEHVASPVTSHFLLPD